MARPEGMPPHTFYNTLIRTAKQFDFGNGRQHIDQRIQRLANLQ